MRTRKLINTGRRYAATNQPALILILTRRKFLIKPRNYNFAAELNVKSAKARCTVDQQ